MEIDCTKLKTALQNFKINSKIRDNKIEIFLRLCSPKPKDVDEVLHLLSENILNPYYTEHIGFHFSYLLLFIIPKAILYGNEKTTHEFFCRNCIALSKLIKYSPDVLKYAYTYFNNLILDKDNIHNVINIKETDIGNTAYLKSVVDLLKYDVSFFRNIWNISEFFEKFFGKNNHMHDYLILQMLSIITEMKKSDLEEITKIIPKEEFLLENNITHLDYKLCNSDKENNMEENVSTEQKLVKTNFINNAGINVEGILLPLRNIDYFNFYPLVNNYFDKIVNVESTKLNLRSIAIGISARKAICLSGPVGSGKTGLVEYLAKVTGRMAPKLQEFYYYYEKQYKNENKIKCDSKIENNLNEKKRKLFDTDFDLGDATSIYENFLTKNEFLRIQLGEQTDSKVLLGQYCCTEVPGEFVWQPGVLVQAVINGYWLLLEDLDLATQDVCTLLTNLLENNYLSVPGYKDYVQIHHGFQLFVTLRTSKQMNTTHQLIFSMLDKNLYTINLLPLSRNELCKIICENYPKLTTVAARIVDVYLTFSSGVHNIDVTENNENSNIENNQENSELKLTSGSNSGRLVSTRDLLKLCKRSHDSFIITSVDCAYSVFQNAVDLFCSHLPNGDTKLTLITSIGAKLGIIKSRCEFLTEEYKPDIEINIQNIKIGRCKIDKYVVMNNESLLNNNDSCIEKRIKADNEEMNNLGKKTKSPIFSFTRLALCLLERISLGVQHNEPILLVGETGVGKTSSVQYLAHQMNRKLVVVNMNNQSDVSDLLGGFKPVDLKYIMGPLRSEFELLFKETYNVIKNEKFLYNLSVCYNHGDFKILVQLMLKIIETVYIRFSKETNKKSINLFSKWEMLKIKLLKLHKTMTKPNSINISFSFISGTLVNCIRNGDWILLDEINLASTETLECLSTILEPNGSVTLLEKGDVVPIKRHPDFRIFSCMNPSTDVGKKDLSIGIRNRFTEFYVDELLAENDLMILISDYLRSTGIKKTLIFNVVKLYKKLRSLAQLELNDGLGNRPVYSLRTLCRALTICAKNLCGSMERNLYESFCLSFLTQLDLTSHDIVLDLIKKYLITDIKAVLSQQIPKPNNGECLNFEGYWIAKGPKEIDICKSYILTNSVRKNLNDLARIISIGKLPILLQGPTSAGKTSLIEYIAKRSGNYCLRINNHEHTDLQEYIGTYTADIDGKLSFKEGVLVQAMKNGFWIILDELNLAPSDILEALNRVLDDNRELFIPETQTLIKAHPNFMLFATQNPPGLYGGRKTLSRAFKNRFIELHFSEIPKHELEIILEKRCLIPCSYSQKMVKTMSDLQINRKTTNKNTFTLRDLFRWGNRYTFADKVLLKDNLYDWNQHLVDEGFLVLSAKIRNLQEENVIEEALFTNFRKKINIENLYDLHSNTSLVTRSILERLTVYDKRTHIVWTTDMRRMAILTAKALAFNEPILLIGPTGCGKTTICQILADIAEKEMNILNCHMHTESADFLGGLRPYRGANNTTLGCETETNKKQLFEWANGPLITSMLEGHFFLVDEISLAEDSVLERLNCVLEPEKTILLAEKGGVNNKFIEDSESLDAMHENEFIIKATSGFQFLATMNPGGDFGKKELSPALRNRFTEIWCNATDSRKDLILICESSLRLGFQIKEHDNVFINAIAVTIINTLFHMKSIINKFNFSIRDILAWINYITSNSNISELDSIVHEKISVCDAVAYGLEILFLDSLEMLAFDTYKEIEIMKQLSFNYLEDQIIKTISKKFSIKQFELKRGKTVENINNKFGVYPFYLSTENNTLFNNDFMFDSPTTLNNLFRVLSALSLKKAILLEGPPGVGKTTLIENIAKQIGYQLVRINLCEHTDVADLFGTDLPAENNIFNNEITKSNNESQLGSFVWRDGPLLSALKSKNTWVLLDELNLAPQSVLEGLNAILDHRGEVFIPELNKVFKLNNTTRIFGAQNPLRQGGGRKGLPQSFLNRFTKVYLRKLNNFDLLNIINKKYSDYFNELKEFFVSMASKENIILDEPISIFDYINMHSEKLCKYNNDVGTVVAEKNIIFDLAERMVKFNDHLNIGLKNLEFGLKGGPFDINLRDILRWCEFLCKIYKPKMHRTDLTNGNFQLNNFLQILFEKMKLVYCERIRTENDRKYIINIFGNIFNCDPEKLYNSSTDISLYWTNNKLYLDNIDVLQISNEELYDINVKEVNKNIPLLLTFQIDKLKNLVECDNNKIPVILCGPSDCGKTKSVNLLSTIQSVMCNFDTVDESVTGSFQQMDLNRHLDLLSRNIEMKLFECIHYCIKKIIVEPNIDNHKQQKHIVNLLHINYEYNKIKHLTNDKMDIENLGKSLDIILFEKHLNGLKNIICLIERENVFYIDFSKENFLIKSLLNILKNLNTLNMGGYFEWVDSKFVKSMKMGELICLEHVNLCSPAILDRLNPCFESGYRYLPLTEKGVSEITGNIEIIKPNKDFNAFLTLDPKNGEISRAMRNRCIEIAFLNEKYSDDDLKQLIHEQGVREFWMIKAILTIHKALRDITDFSVFGVSHILRFAFLVTQNCRFKMNNKEALFNSAMEIYVRSSHIDLIGYGLKFFHSKLQETIETIIQNVQPDTNIFNYDNIILKANRLNEYSMIKLQVEPFLILIKCFLDPTKELDRILKDLSENYKCINIKLNQKLLYYLLYFLYNTSTYNDLNKRNLYIQKMLNILCNDFENKDIIVNLLKTNNKLHEIITNSKLYENITKENIHTELKTIPWNSILYPRINVYDKYGCIDIKLQRILSAELLFEIIMEPYESTNILKLKEISLINYSNLITKGKIQDKINDSCIKYFSNFIDTFKQYFSTMINFCDSNLLCSKQYYNILSTYLWCNRFINLSKTNLISNTNDINLNLIDSLKLHYFWFNKKFKKITKDINVVGNNLNQGYEVFQQIMVALNNLHDLNDRSNVNTVRKVFNKKCTNYVPFYTDNQINYYENLKNLLNKTKLIDNLKEINYNSFKKTLYIIHSDCYKEIKNSLIDYTLMNQLEILKFCFNENENNYKNNNINIYKSTEICINKISLLNIIKNDAVSLECFNKFNKICELQDNNINDQLNINILPLYDYFGMKVLNTIFSCNEINFNYNYFTLCTIFNYNFMNTINLKKNETFLICQELWNSYEENTYKDFNSIDKNNYKNFFKNRESLPNHFYSNFSALQNNIELNIYKLQSKSISLNNKVFVNNNNENVYNHILETRNMKFSNGIILTDYLMNMLLNVNGETVSPGLGDLNNWSFMLKDMTKLLWQNIDLYKTDYNFEDTNLKRSINNSKKLLLDIGDTMNYCNEKYERKYYEDEYYEKLVNKLFEVQKEVEHTDITKNRDNKIYYIGLLNALQSSIEFYIVVYLPLVDPVEKCQLKKLYTEDEIDFYENLISSYDFTRSIMNYKSLGVHDTNIMHENISVLKENLKKYSKKLAVRPKKSLYRDLVSDVNHYLITCCAPKILYNLINTIDECLSTLYKDNELSNALQNINDIAKRIDLWISNSMNFEYLIINKYSSFYNDFIQPIEYIIAKFQYSLTILKYCLMKKHDNILYNHKNNMKINSILENLIKFPNVNGIGVNDGNNVFKLLKNVNGVNNEELQVMALIKIWFYEVENNVILSENIENSFNDFDNILKVLNKLWQKQEDNKKKQQIEEDSLYVTKTKCATEDEQAIINEELEELFPNYVDQDFGEFIQTNTLEQTPIKPTKDNTNIKTNLNIIFDDDLKLICDKFMDIMEHYSKSYYYDNKQSTNVNLKNNLDFLTPYKLKYEIFSKLYNVYKNCLSSDFDEANYISLSVLLGTAQENCGNFALTDTRKTYNIYKDSNVPEILNCLELLKRIELRVQAELEQWPDHATLNDIIKIIKRIYMLPSSSSIVRFNTGFQLLRQKLDEWNNVAHRNNNLCELETEVSRYVQQWMSLELKCWRECLTQTYNNVEKKAYKFWFLIYNLIHEYLNDENIKPMENGNLFEKYFDSCQLNSTNTTGNIKSNDIIKVIKDFIETSNYGEFNLRMKIVKAFEKYLNYINVKNEHKKNNLISILYNIYLYYDQFSNEINEIIKQKRGPIEKKLKAYIKIQSYMKDLSYFSMRNNIATVHRNLHKFLKEYEIILNIKINTIFVNKNNLPDELIVENDKGKNLRHETKIKYYMIDVKNFLTSVRFSEKYLASKNVEHLNNLNLLAKMPKFFLTSRKIVRRAIIQMDYPNLIYNLDMLLSEQIETCEHLRKLEVDRSKEKIQQKSQAKSILQQKRKTLSDLYKTLKKLGINYRTGIMEKKLNNNLINMKIRPFCVKMFNNFNYKKFEKNLFYLNENIDLYYNKCIFKLKLLDNILIMPHTDIDSINSERMNGYSIDMFLLIEKQRISLSKTTNELFNTKMIINNLIDLHNFYINDNINNYVSEVNNENKYHYIKSSLQTIRSFTEQYKIYLRCAPETMDENLSVNNSNDKLIKTSDKYIKIHKLLEQILDSCTSLYNDMMKQDGSKYFSINLINDYEAKFKIIMNDLNLVDFEFKFDNTEEKLIIGKSLEELIIYLNNGLTNINAQEFDNNQEKDILESDDYNTELENIIHSILISMQKIYKKYSINGETLYDCNISDNTENNVEESNKHFDTTDTVNKENNEDNDILEHHLKEKINKDMEDDLKIINIEIINSRISNLLKSVKKCNDSKQKLDLINKIIRIIPILEQYSLLGEYYLVQQFGAHKVATKMLSIMLSVFIELGTKGFCVPPDLLQDEDGQSKKQEKKNEGFGLDDGTGENDVSDRIENEDQLDDAKKPNNDDKEDKDDQDCKEEKGIDMSEDFDSKLQNLDKKDNESDESDEEDENEEELDKEMDETEQGADKLDDQIWGSDDEKDEQSEEELKDDADGKGSNETDDQHNDSCIDKNEMNNKEEDNGLDAADNDTKKEKTKDKDIDDQTGDEEQTNTGHNELEDPPEADPMEINECNLDNNEMDENEENNEDNPFDIDKMKEQMEISEEIDETDKNSDIGEDEENNNLSSDDEEIKDDPNQPNGSDNDEADEINEEEDDTKKNNNEQDENKASDNENCDNDKIEDEEDVNNPKQPENEFHESKDNISKEDNVQSMPAEKNKGSFDHVKNENEQTQSEKMDTQDTGDDKDGVGQADNEESKNGHQGVSESNIQKSNETSATKDNENKRKQGNTEDDRSLSDELKSEHKRLKTIDKLNKNKNIDNKEQEKEQDNITDTYQHVKEAKSTDKTTLDNATEEQSKQIRNDNEHDDEPDTEDAENGDDLMDDNNMSEDIEDDIVDKIDGEQISDLSKKPSKNEDKMREKCETKENVDVDGEIVNSMEVMRGSDTTAHSIVDILNDSTVPQEPTQLENLEARRMYEREMNKNNLIVTNHENFDIWQSISNKMLTNARELCEQLRLILEPTKCTRLKGDYRTGKRINMRKIIPYIASDYRKDKIWLRRTKPAQRDYKISIAIDDSKSMHHNNSKNLTLQAISLVSQALTLLESGKLSIVSFGEKPSIILKFTDLFDGPKLVSSLNFSQNQSRIGELLDFVRIANSEDASNSSNNIFENLLIVLSDGRNIYSEGEQKVKNSVKLARLQRIFIVYIIIDNPENKHSILDIRVPSFSLDRKSITMKSYLDTFPFPYYVIVRDLNQLPIVLSDAMRQWFELVNSEQ